MELLKSYLDLYNTDLQALSKSSGISISTLRNLDQRHLDSWSIKYLNIISKHINKSNEAVLKELKELSMELQTKKNVGVFDISNRRYIGSKRKLQDKISDLIIEHTSGETFFDVFAGTGVITQKMLPNFKNIIINDFLYSNEQIYHAFFGQKKIDKEKLLNFHNKFNNIQYEGEDNYFSYNFGGRYFSKNDAFIIGEIREAIETARDLNSREKSVLIASLIYSADRVSNTVGHYDAYRKVEKIEDKFKFELIKLDTILDKNIEIYREDANALVRKVKADVAFIDPPYNSRQYSRFYHVLENLAKWDKPKLFGVALKPPAENMSLYSRVTAPKAFEDLIANLDTKYIVVTYNNTYLSKSNSSRNKIEHEEILQILNSFGKTKVYEIPYQFFSAGKTSFINHKEYIFITEVFDE